MAEEQDITSEDRRRPLLPWTEIPFIPLPRRDPTAGGQFLSQAREINIGDSGDQVFRVGRDGMWLGAKLYADAPFKVSFLGAAIMESLTIIGGVITGPTISGGDISGATITGGTIQTSALATTGIKLDTTSFRGYNSGGKQVIVILASSGAFQAFGFSGSTVIRTINIAGDDSGAGVGIEDANTAAIGFQWIGPSSGTNIAARTNVPAYYHFNKNCEHGDGFTSKNTDTTWDGKHFQVIPNTNKNISAFHIVASAWTGIFESKISTEGYLSFPAFFHYSEFEELPAALASSVIANAFWVGGGTSGTQIISAEGADGLAVNVTYVRLSTTATASRSSTMTHRRTVELNLQARWDALIRHSTGITTTEQQWGWYYDATHYAYFNFDTDQHATKVYFAHRDGGAETLTDISVSMPTDGQFHRYVIQSYIGKFYLYIDDALVATISTTITDYGKAYFYVDNKATAVERTMDIDYVKTWQGRTLSP